MLQNASDGLPLTALRSFTPYIALAVKFSVK